MGRLQQSGGSLLFPARRSLVLFDEAVFLVEYEHMGLGSAGFRLGALSEGANDDPVSRQGVAGGGTVDDQLALTGLAHNGVRLEAVAVIAVEDLHLLVGQDARLFEPFRVDRQAAGVFGLDGRDGDAMELTDEDFPQHGARFSARCGQVKALDFVEEPLATPCPEAHVPCCAGVKCRKKQHPRRTFS